MAKSKAKIILKVSFVKVLSCSDPISRSSESLFLQLVPHSKRVVVRGAGHFLQETHGQQLADNVLQFLARE